MNSILPVLSSTPFERTHDLTAEAQLALPVPIRTLVRPSQIEPALLPFLAWGLSSDLWQDEWPIEVKRAVVAEWFDLHRYKGTAYGISRHIEIAGGRLEKVVAPPQAAFAGAEITREVRQSWLDQMPQLRIYPYYRRGIDQRGGFVGPREKAFAGHFYPRDHRAGQRNRRFAMLYEPRDGSLIPLSYTVRVTRAYAGPDVVEYEEVVRPRRARGYFAGQIVRTGTIVAAADVPGRTYRFGIDRPFQASLSQLQDRTYDPGLDPIDVYPEHVTEKGTAGPRQLFAGGCVGGGRCAQESTAWQRVYERIYLNDPARMVPIRRGTMFAGRARLGIAAYTAELTVDVSSVRPARQFFAGRCAGRLLAAAHDNSKLDRVLAAIRVSKALRDVVMVQTYRHRTVQFGDLWRADGLTFGGVIRDI